MGVLGISVTSGGLVFADSHQMSQYSFMARRRRKEKWNTGWTRLTPCQRRATTARKVEDEASLEGDGAILVITEFWYVPSPTPHKVFAGLEDCHSQGERLLSVLHLAGHAQSTYV